MQSLVSVTARRCLHLGVGKGELLSRFLLSTGDYAKTEKRVKPRAFIPPKGGGTSCFRVDGMTIPQIRRMGEAKVADVRGKTMRGWATLSASVVAAQGLGLDANDEPARHVNLTSWPEEKDEQLEIAQELAAAAKLHVLEIEVGQG